MDIDSIFWARFMTAKCAQLLNYLDTFDRGNIHIFQAKPEKI